MSRLVFEKYRGDPSPFLTDVLTGVKMRSALVPHAEKIKRAAIANAAAVQVKAEDSQEYINSIKVSYTTDREWYRGGPRVVALVQAGEGIPGRGRNGTFRLAVWFEHKYRIMMRALGAAR